MEKKYITIFVSFLLLFILLPAAAAQAEGTATLEVAVDKANLRSEPSTSSSLVGQVQRHAQYEIIGEENDWYQIQLSDGTKGWIAGYLVSVKNGNSPASEPAQVQGSSGETAAITADNLNVRSEPSLSSTVLGKLHIGDQVTVSSVEGDWVSISYNGQDAWVSKQFVRLNEKTEQASAAPAPSSEPAEGMAIILYEGTNLRSGPDTSSSIVAQGSQGERYPIRARSGDWYEISLASGQAAYVASWVVSTNESAEEAPDESSNVAAASNDSPGLAGKTIVLDPGHGGVDSGTIGAQGTLEKVITLKTAERLYGKLKHAGANVILTRSHDEHVSLPSRTAAARYHGADAFISLHYDSTVEHAGARGFTTYYYHANHRQLANEVNSGLDQQLSARNRGVRHGDYHVIRENSQPAILLELGYLNNPQEEAAIVTTPYQEMVTNGIYYGLQSYFSN
ncbi:N-acetylmuramoyl-L-alanine amidase [Bacillus thermotolerans]|uniref:N-acetylmuramoyl-L-alanine amidase n=1 Tax=Bacillus thermotolerans TaxID=1221996 RepID=A0A0F5ICY1_BACTR|nr:N-acetylmuramoyl-L-alanine amidase [Bacillus thermotolerans]KKB43449.1 N-acetylmuramoyl-L-alanine amidase [Bacillus thermotolerans]